MLVNTLTNEPYCKVLPVTHCRLKTRKWLVKTSSGWSI